MHTRIQCSRYVREKAQLGKKEKGCEGRAFRLLELSLSNADYLHSHFFQSHSETLAQSPPRCLSIRTPSVPLELCLLGLVERQEGVKLLLEGGEQVGLAAEDGVNLVLYLEHLTGLLVHVLRNLTDE